MFKTIYFMKKLTLIGLLFIPFLCSAQEKWDLKKNQDGIAVYAAKLDGEKFKRIRVICEMNCSVDQLIRVMSNVDHHKDWIYNTKVSTLINRKNRDTVVYYSEVSLPWPVSNRDLVMEQCFVRDSINKSLKIEVTSQAHAIPVKPNLVRVPYSLGIWHVTTLANNHIRIDYTFKVDPGGSIPAWVVNLMATAGPFNTFRNLKNILEARKG